MCTTALFTWKFIQRSMMIFFKLIVKIPFFVCCPCLSISSRGKMTIKSKWLETRSANVAKKRVSTVPVSETFLLLCWTLSILVLTVFFYTLIIFSLLPHSLCFILKKPIVEMLNFNCHGRWPVDLNRLNSGFCDVCLCTGDQDISSVGDQAQARKGISQIINRKKKIRKTSNKRQR